MKNTTSGLTEDAFFGLGSYSLPFHEYDRAYCLGCCDYAVFSHLCECFSGSQDQLLVLCLGVFPPEKTVA